MLALAVARTPRSEASGERVAHRRDFSSDEAVLCPVCQLDQVIVEWGGVELDVCVECHGIWFDADELRHLFAAAGVPDAVSSLEQRLQALPRSGRGSRRHCPRCRARMDHVSVPEHPEQTVLDRCPRGHGLWFDQGELEQIVDREIDVGDPALDRVRAHLDRFIHPERGGEEPEA
jgi:Zn-finger nucleic acid-binding protein